MVGAPYAAAADAARCVDGRHVAAAAKLNVRADVAVDAYCTTHG